MTDNQGLMRCKDVVELTKLGTGTIYRLMDLGSFPRPVRVDRVRGPLEKGRCSRLGE